MWVLILLLSLMGFSEYVDAGEEDGAEPVLEYIEMVPKFTVNLAERKKYLLINIQLMVEGEDNIDKIKKHFPVLRHELIMLLSGRPVAELQTAEQRESLRKEAIETVKETLNKYVDSDGFRDLFFTEFLVN